MLLSLSGISKAETLDLNVVVAAIVHLLQFTLPANITVNSTPNPEPVKVTTDRFPAQQILMELVGGARERMPLGGTLTVNCANIDVSDEFSREHPAVPSGLYGVLQVTDTGTTAHKESRYPPAGLLTPAGVSAWLEGLQAAIRLAGGYLWCYSELGKGSTYSVYFPRATEAAS